MHIINIHIPKNLHKLYANCPWAVIEYSNIDINGNDLQNSNFRNQNNCNARVLREKFAQNLENLLTTLKICSEPWKFAQNLENLPATLKICSLPWLKKCLPPRLYPVTCIRASFLKKVQPSSFAQNRLTYTYQNTSVIIIQYQVKNQEISQTSSIPARQTK